MLYERYLSSSREDENHARSHSKLDSFYLPHLDRFRFVSPTKMLLRISEETLVRVLQHKKTVPKLWNATKLTPTCRQAHTTGWKDYETTKREQERDRRKTAITADAMDVVFCVHMHVKLSLGLGSFSGVAVFVAAPSQSHYLMRTKTAWAILRSLSPSQCVVCCFLSANALLCLKCTRNPLPAR